MDKIFSPGWLGDLDSATAMKHIRWLTENAPRRLSGLGDDELAAEYVCDRLADYGLEARLERFETYNSSPVSSKLTVLAPERLLIDSLPCCHILSTPKHGIQTELVDVGAGGESDYQGKEVRGKAVLVEVSYAPPTPEKARIASSRGALALICMNWGQDQPVICNRGLKAVWGNPTPESFGDIPRVTGLSISRRDGERLKSICATGQPVKVLIQAEADNRWQTLVQPVAMLPAAATTEQFILVSGHLDAWEPGVTCNATGNAVMLELARFFSQRRELLRRNLIFAFWNGHEIAEAAGSTWFVDNYWDLLRDHCIGNFTIDSPGIANASRYQAYVSQELADFVTRTLRGTLTEDIHILNLRKIGDQSFLGLGLPSIYGRMSLSEEGVRANNGATLGWWNHTLEDTLDKADQAVIAKDLTAYATLIAKLSNSAILPYNFSRTIAGLRTSLEGLAGLRNDPLNLNGLIETTKLLQAEVVRLNDGIAAQPVEGSAKRRMSVINHCLMKLSRLLTSPFQTACDRYGQDSYGLSALSKPLPLLYRLEELTEMEPAAVDYKLLLTGLLRKRNRISDALQEAVDTVKRAMEHLV